MGDTTRTGTTLWRVACVLSLVVFWLWAIGVSYQLGEIQDRLDEAEVLIVLDHLEEEDADAAEEGEVEEVDQREYPKVEA